MMMIACGGGGGNGVTASLGDYDVPYAVLGLGADKSLGTEASAKEVDSSESLPALHWVRADAPLECTEDLRLPRLAHGLILGALDCRAKVGINREQDVLNGDDPVPRRKSGIRPDVEHPGKIANAKRQRGQWRAGGGLAEDGRGETWVCVGGLRPHIVQKAGRRKRKMNVHAWSERSWWNVGERMTLGDGRWGVDLRLGRRMVW